MLFNVLVSGVTDRFLSTHARLAMSLTAPFLVSVLKCVVYFLYDLY
jgi:hypothetical protein